MNLTVLTRENLEKEHICCAISNNNDPQVASKKAWLRERLDEGLMFVKGDVRGKCFIEYIPAEYAWTPVDADGYMFIDCFWVSGQFKGQGYSNLLLDFCVRDAMAKGKRGICAISSPKKMPFLSDPGHLAYKGFRVADSADPYFTLMYLPFSDAAPAPRFLDCVRHPNVEARGFDLYYTPGCPFTAKYVPLIEELARENGVPFRSVRLDTREKARSAPAAWTNYALFRDGKFLTHEILSEKKFLKLIQPPA